MERFEPGVDSWHGAGIPASLMRFSDPASTDGLSRHPAAIAHITLIAEQPSTLAERFQQLCFWRQVIHAEYN